MTEERNLPQSAATHSVEDTALSTTREFSTELAPSAAAAEKQYEIQSAIIIAKRFPRDEDLAFQKLMKACGRSSFAEDAEYAFPRGGTTVKGPSVFLAREGARVWTNIRYGLTILRDDQQSRQIQGWAWDVETNTKVTAEDDFQKLIYRKGKGWITPDERDLRELTNRRGAILIRNCVLQLLPKDLVEDAVEKCRETLRSTAAKDPDEARKKIILAFSELNITPEMLAVYLGHPIGQSSPAEIADLRGIYKSISDGNSKWSEYVAEEAKTNGDANGGTNGANGGQSKTERLAEQLKNQQGNTAASSETSANATPAADDSASAPAGAGATPSLPLEPSEPIVLDGVTFPANLRCTSLADKASLDQHTLMTDECERIGVKLSAELKKYLKVDFDDLNKDAAQAFIEFLKGRKSKGAK